MSTASRLPHRRSRALLLHSVVRCSCTLSSASAPIGVAQGRCHGARGAVCGCGCSCLPGARAGAGAGARAQVRVVHRGLELIAHGLQCVAQLQPDWHLRAQLQHRAHCGAHLLRMSLLHRGRMTSRANHRRARRSPSHRAHCAAQRSARP